MKSNLTGERRALLQKIRSIVFTNPFSVTRKRLDAEILGRPVESDPRGASLGDYNLEYKIPLMIAARAREELLAIAEPERRSILAAGGEDALLLRDVIGFILFHQYYQQMDEMIVRSLGAEGDEVHKKVVPFYASYEREIARWFDLRDLPAGDVPQTDDSLALPPPSGHLIIDPQWAARLFSFLYQVRRAYYLIYYHIVGVSPAMTRLRESVWDAIFTRNVEWYWRFLLGKMADFSTLITGPTGAGKELIAQAIGRAQYLPLNPKTRRFEHDGRALFLPVNLAALSPTLIESELFGHVKGAFTGAVETREGLMAGCSRNGAIFLDEIGELPPSIQVTLLRVLQTRRFYQLGSRREVPFEGRIISATNQDVAGLIRDGGMREDFYYRLSACPIQAPSLRERFDEEPEEIASLTLFLLRRILGAEDAALEAMIIDRVGKVTAAGRPWRGNVRELEQFIRNCLAGRELDSPVWIPPAPPPDGKGARGADWVSRAARADLTLDELLGRYCRLARDRYETYDKAAAALNADWRTIKKWAQWREAPHDVDDAPDGGG